MKDEKTEILDEFVQRMREDYQFPVLSADLMQLLDDGCVSDTQETIHTEEGRCGEGPGRK